MCPGLPPRSAGSERCLHGAWTELLLEEFPPARDMEGEVCGPRRALHMWPGSVGSGLCSCVFVPPSTVRLSFCPSELKSGSR